MNKMNKLFTIFFLVAFMLPLFAQSSQKPVFPKDDAGNRYFFNVATQRVESFPSAWSIDFEPIKLSCQWMTKNLLGIVLTIRGRDRSKKFKVVYRVVKYRVSKTCSRQVGGAEVNYHVKMSALAKLGFAEVRQKPRPKRKPVATEPFDAVPELSLPSPSSQPKNETEKRLSPSAPDDDWDDVFGDGGEDEASKKKTQKSVPPVSKPVSRPSSKMKNIVIEKDGQAYMAVVPSELERYYRLLKKYFPARFYDKGDRDFHESFYLFYEEEGKRSVFCRTRAGFFWKFPVIHVESRKDGVKMCSLGVREKPGVLEVGKAMLKALRALQVHDHRVALAKALFQGGYIAFNHYRFFNKTTGKVEELRRCFRIAIQGKFRQGKNGATVEAAKVFIQKTKKAGRTSYRPAKKDGSEYFFFQGNSGSCWIPVLEKVNKGA